jgi:hypothetical protein
MVERMRRALLPLLLVAACSSSPAVPPEQTSSPPPSDTPAPDPTGAVEDKDGGGAVKPAALEWPNAESKTTSDQWLVDHHDAITKMRPKVIAINLDNDPKTRSNFKNHVGQLIAGLKEGSRFRGYDDKSAEPFLEYEVSKWVDLADDAPPAGWTHKYSTKVPVACVKDDAWYDADYSRLFDPAWGGFDLCAEFAKGDAHEVWLHMNGDNDPYECPDGTMRQPGFAEILEAKPIRDAKGVAKPGVFERCAGNGCLGARDFAAFKACGRTVRVLYINSTRGPGCAIHSAGHGFEWMARSEATGPALWSAFEKFGNFDFEKRLGTPFGDWYACDSPNCITFTGPNSLTWKVKDETGTIASFDQGCGNVHFAPNARAHYDENDNAVMSTCETWGDAAGVKPRAFSRKSYAQYEPLAPDCGGAWQVYWRQSFQKKWWPYIFY